MLVSGDSVIYIHTFILFHLLFSYRLSQNLGRVCYGYTVGPCWLSIFYIVVVVGGLVTKSCPTLVTPWTVACQAPPCMGFSRQEYWSGLPFPSPLYSSMCMLIPNF